MVCSTSSVSIGEYRGCIQETSRNPSQNEDSTGLSYYDTSVGTAPNTRINYIGIPFPSTVEDSSGHKSTVRKEFTKQARDYAESSILTDPEKIDSLIQATGASSEARVLEVATGPGHVAFGFAEECDQVIGIDITEAQLEIAKGKKEERGIDDIQFEKGDAEDLPYENNSFDAVVCRLAFHHFEDPSLVIEEMARVCRPNGTIAIDDIIVSEFSERASYQNTFESLRDPSHVRALPLSEIIALFSQSKIEVMDVTSGVNIQEVEQWLSLAKTTESQADEVRQMIEEDASNDLSGTRPFWQDGELYFIQKTAIVVGRRLHESKLSDTQ